MDAIDRTLEEVRREFAPDPRCAIFEVDVEFDGPIIVFRGACSEPLAAEALHSRVAALEARRVVRDEIVRLPEESAELPAHAIVTAAIAPMLAGPIITESPLSQVPCGHRVVVLRERGRWLQCRSGDGYLGWIHRGYLRRVEEEAAREWETDVALHVSLGAELLGQNGETRVRLPWGARLTIEDGLGTIADGRSGSVRGEVVARAELFERFPLDGSDVVATGRTWEGVPYLWGGVTPWGADCSGFAQAIYRMHGHELPRDSDQQAMTGEAVTLDEGLTALRLGDLLFFAERPEPISHVAISMGGSRIVHCSVGNGGVTTNDLLGESGYERELRTLLVAARRITPAG